MYHDGLMFGLVPDDILYLKVGASLRARKPTATANESQTQAWLNALLESTNHQEFVAVSDS